MTAPFTDRELALIRKTQNQPPHTVAQIVEACTLHSVCTPLPLFRVYKIDDNTFEAQWNDFHKEGARQTFRFTDVISPWRKGF